MSAKKKTDPVNVVSSTTATINTPSTDLFNNLGKKAPLVALGLIFVIGFIVFKDYLLFDKAYFFKDIGSDSYNFSLPFLYHEAGYIAQHGLPKWSFGFGMGQSLFPFFLRDPFDIFLYIAGKDHIMFGIIYKEFIKILLGGITFYYYLKTLKLSDYTSITGSILFAFCGFTIVGSGWYIFSFESFNMALLLLSYEQLVNKKQWYLFPFAIFLICISQPFNLYVYGIFMITYVLLRQAQSGTLSLKSTGLVFLQMIGLGVLGMLLSAPLMIENIFQLLESPRGSGTNSYASVLLAQPMFATADKVQFGTSVMRLFSSDMVGSGNEVFKGWQNFLEAPLFYCGLPCLLLTPQVFQFLDKKVKIAFGIFLAVWLLPVIFPYFRYAFWLFTGDYYRAYSVLVAFTLLYYSLLALDRITKTNKINLTTLIATVISLFILLNYPYFPESDSTNSAITAFVSVFILGYGALLYFMSKQSSPVYLKYIFMGVVVLELIYMSNLTANNRDSVIGTEVSEKTAYNDYTVDAVNYIKSKDKSFYRIDKTYASSPAIHYSLNDAMAQDYRGSSGYSPFNQEYYIKYLQTMGISNKENELESRWANGLAYRPLLESQNQVKYILAKTHINPIWNIVCDSIGTFGDVKAFRNKFVIPFGYTHNTFIRQSIFETLSLTQRDFISLRAVAIRDEDLSKVSGMKEFRLQDTTALAEFNFDFYRQNVNELSKDTLVISKFEETALNGKINVTEDKILYLSIPYDGGWTLKVNGKEADKLIIDGGMTGVLLKKGQYTIDMNYDLRFFTKGVYLFIVGLLLYIGLWFVTRKKKNADPAIG